MVTIDYLVFSSLLFPSPASFPRDIAGPLVASQLLCAERFKILQLILTVSRTIASESDLLIFWGVREAGFVSRLFTAMTMGWAWTGVSAGFMTGRGSGEQQAEDLPT